MKFRKKLFSILLSVSMVLSLFPYGVFAEGNDPAAAASPGSEVTQEGSTSGAQARVNNDDTTGAAGQAAIVDDPDAGSGSDTNSDTASTGDGNDTKAGNGSSDGDSGSGGSTADGEPSDEEPADAADDSVFENDLFINIQPEKDDKDVPIDTAETGEKLTARFYAFNDNPNATAIALIRVYADQVTRDTDHSAVTHEDRDKIVLRGTIGDKATRITAEWKTLKADDPENDRDYAVDYLEFELPAGASIDCGIELETETGYDEEIKAEVYADYKIADRSGKYPDEWINADEENKAVLTWTGTFEWDSFSKTADPLAVGFGSGKFQKDTVDYKFSVKNKKLDADSGVIYTDYVILEDTVQLPDMLSLPEVQRSDNKLVTSAGKTVYEINVSDYEYTVEELQRKDAHNIYFRIRINNADVTRTDFDPLKKASSTLYLEHMSVSPSEQFTDPDADPVLIINTASIEVESVPANGDKKRLDPYTEEDKAEVEIIPSGSIRMFKNIISVKDTAGNSVSDVDEEWQVKRNYKVTYQISLVNSSDFDKTVNGLTDTLPKGLTLNQNSVVTRVGEQAAKSDIDFVSDAQAGTMQIRVNGFVIPAKSTGTVTYTVTVDEKDYSPDTMAAADLPLKNVASYEDTVVEVPVRRMPEEKITIKKQVVARYTKALNGEQLVLSADWDPRTEQYSNHRCIGNANSIYRPGDSGIQNADIERALHEINGGDTIVYRIYLLNEGDTDFRGTIYDFSPFSGNPTSTGANTSAQYYKYQATGFKYNNYSFYYETKERGTSRMQSGNLGFSYGGVTCDPEGSGIVVGAQDFAKAGAGMSVYEGSRALFTFFNDNYLAAGHDYVQSMILVAPGDQYNAIVSDSGSGSDFYRYGNAAFEKLATAYSVSSEYGRKQDLGHCVLYSTASEPNGSSNYVYHFITGQTSIDTGIIATWSVPDINNIKDGDIRVPYSGSGDQWKKRPDSDMKTFQAKESQAIVNYVYVFNDSDKPMDMKYKKIALNIPDGFKYLGLTQPNSSVSEDDAEGTSYYKFAKPSHSATVNVRNKNILSVPMIRGGYTISSNDWGHRHPEQLTESNHNDFAHGVSATIHDSTEMDSGTRGTRVDLDARNITLPAYTGMMFYYVVSVDDVNTAKRYNINNKAKFAVEMIEQRSGVFIPRRSPVCKVMEYYVFNDTTRRDLDNPGIMSSYENKSGVNWIDGRCNTASEPTLVSMKAGVEIYERTEDSYNIRVRKEVLKNSGEDRVDRYRDGNIYRIGDLTTKYDDYNWDYIPHDGVHRTVDGTVTWKMEVGNQGTGADRPFSYGLLSDTIDSPYELAEINIPKLIFHEEDGSANSEMDNIIFKLPLDDSGWDTIDDKTSVYTYDTETGGKADSANGSFTSPRIRVTRKRIPNGSIGWGYDVTWGDQNTGATRYVIEVSDYVRAGTVYKPILKLSETLTMYMTFATTDSIETNYNSFALVLPGVNIDHIKTTSGKKITIDRTHESTGTVVVPTVRSAAAKPASDPADSVPKLKMFGAGAVSASGYATGGASANETADPKAPAVEYSDWTDTSYTDALKTTTAKGKSINSREHGNMILPKLLATGDKIHTRLEVESVIYESENYSYFDKLVIYDLFGTSDKFSGNEKGLCGYDKIDFEHLKVTDSRGHEYTRGVDYDLLYTDANLVYLEHHPIDPVNTLKYAADYGLVTSDTITWRLYEGGDVSGTDAHAFKIVFRDGVAAVYNNRNDIGMDVPIPAGALQGKCSIYVDFDAEVPDPKTNPAFHLGSNYSYPNIEMYTSRMHVIGSTEIKPFWEDTTALIYKPKGTDSIKFKKTTRIEEGLADPGDRIFKYLLIKSSSNAGPGNKDNVKAAAVLEAEPDVEYDLSEGKNLNLIYKDDESVKSVEDFFYMSDEKIYIFEIDSGVYVPESIKTYGTNKNLNAVEADYAIDLGDLETEDEAVNRFLTENQGKKIKGLRLWKKDVSEEAAFAANIEGVNAFMKRDLSIRKTDEDGNSIKNPVTFNLLDEAGNTVKLSKEEGSYVFDESGSETDIILKGETVRVNDLPPGKYTLVETKAPYGYKLSGDGRTQFDTSEGTASKPIELVVKDPADEEVQSGELNLKKIDADTKKVITADKAYFEIYGSKEEGAKPLTFILDENGTYVYAPASSGEYHTSLSTKDGLLHAESLPFGTYYVVETKAPKGYLAAGTTLDKATEITVSRTDAFAVTEISNTAVDGKVTINKIDADDEKAVTGSQATFNIQSEDGTVLKFREKTEGTDGTYVYDAEGNKTDLKTSSATGKLVITGLEPGKFKVIEKEAPVGYKVSTESTAFEIRDNEPQTVTVSDETAEAALKLIKTWKLEGARKERPLADVEFTLYKLDAETNTAKSIGSGTTDKNGELKFGDLDWKATYYLAEKVPAGYTQGSDVRKAYINDATGEIDFNITEATEGYTETEVSEVNMKGRLEEDGNEFVCTEPVLNVKNMVYGGMYGSVSYKTIDNSKAAAEYEGLEARTGYGFYYTDQDHAAGNYNYVEAVNPGDIVTYTLNVSNVSDYDFGKFAIIDRLPESGDTGVVNLREKRDSEFTVSNNDGKFKVEVDGNVIDPSMYEVSFSDKVEFTNGDFNGTTEWTGSYGDAKSVRIAFKDDFLLEPGQTVKVTFDGKISDEAKPGEFAWNDFAYRYTAITDEDAPKKGTAAADDDKIVTKSAKANGKAKDVVIIPEPPKVGVRIVEGKTVIGGEKKYECRDSSLSETETFTFRLTRSDSLEYGVTYKDKSGKLTEFPADGLTVDVKATLNGDAVKFEFPELHFSHTGKYEFDVKEIAGSNTDVKYDPAEYHVVVDGTDVTEYTSEDGITPAYTLGGKEADTAAFVNTRKTGDLTVSKTVESDLAADKDRVFKFTVALTDKAVSGTYGDMTFENGVATFTLKDGESASATGLPAAVVYHVEEEADSEFITQSENGTGNIVTGQPIEAKFTNTRKTGDLTVSKTVESDLAADSDAVFNFTVTLSDDTISGTYGDMTFENGTATFTLKDGESSSATGLPSSVEYAVEEEPAEGFSTDSENEAGIINDVKASEAKFTNTRKTGSLEVSKEVISDAAADKDAEFEFTVTLSEKTISSGVFGTVTKKYGDMTFRDGVASFKLKGGESITAENLPVGVEYTVTEADAEGFILTGRTGDAGVITETKSEAVFTNTRTTGDLTVSKTVIGSKAEKADDYSFTVTLDDKTISGEYGDMTFEDGVARFTLTDGESITAEGLPTGIGYTVREDAPDGCEVTKTGETGTITESSADRGPARAGFVNVFASGSNVIYGKKVFRNGDLSKQSFRFELCDKETGKVLQTAETGKEGLFFFEPLEYTLRDLAKGDGTYDTSREFVYVVKEVVPAGADRNGYDKKTNIQYDLSEKEVTVVVTNKGHGQLEVSVKGGLNISFENIYSKKGVKTGDSNNILIPLAVMLSAMLTLLIIAERRRRNA